MIKRVIFVTCVSALIGFAYFVDVAKSQAATGEPCIKCKISGCPQILFNGDLVQSHKDDSTGTLRSFEIEPTGYHEQCAIETEDDEYLGVCPHDDCSGSGEEIEELVSAIDSKDLNAIAALVESSNRISLNDDRKMIQVGTCSDVTMVVRQFSLSDEQYRKLIALRD